MNNPEKEEAVERLPMLGMQGETIYFVKKVE